MSLRCLKCFVWIVASFMCVSMVGAVETQYDIHKEIPLRFIYQGADTGGVDLSTGWFPLIALVTDAEGYLSAGNTPVALSYSAKLIMECNSTDIWAGNQARGRAWIEVEDSPEFTELYSNFGISFGIKFRDWWFEEEFAEVGKDFGMNISTDGPMPMGTNVMCGIDYISCSSLPLSEIVGTVSQAASSVISTLGEGVDMASVSLAGELVVEGNYVQLIFGDNTLQFTGFGVENAQPFFIYIPQDLCDSGYYDPENNVLTFDPLVQYSLNLYRTMGIKLTLVGPLAFDIMPNIVNEGENVEANILDYNCPTPETLHDPDFYKKVADDFKIGANQYYSVSFPVRDRPFLPDMTVTDIRLGYHTDTHGRIFSDEWTGIDFTITNIGERSSESTASFVYTIKIDGEYAHDPLGFDLQDRRLEDANGNLIVLAPNESYILRSFSWPFTEGPHTLEFRVGYIEYKGDDAYGNPIYALADYDVSNNVVVRRIYTSPPRGTVTGRVLPNPCLGDCGINGIRVCLSGESADGSLFNACMDTANDGSLNGAFRFENVPTGDYNLEFIPPVPTSVALEKGEPWYAPRSFLFHHESSDTDDFNYATAKSGMFLTQFQSVKGIVCDEEGSPVTGVRVEMGDVAVRSTTTALETINGAEVSTFTFEKEAPRGKRTIRFYHDLYEYLEIEYDLLVSSSEETEQWVNSYRIIDPPSTLELVEGPVRLIPDKTSPSLFVEPLADGGFGAATLSFNLASDDEAKKTAFYSYEIYSGTTRVRTGDWMAYPEQTDSQALVPAIADLSGLVDGAYTLVVKAQDLVGNITSSSPIAFVKDTTPPAVTVVLKDPITHLATSTDSKTVDVEISVTNTESGRLAAQLSNDNVSWSDPVFFTGATTTIPSWQITERDVFTGSKTVYVRLTDPAGNTGSGSDSIDVDTTGAVVLGRGSRYVKDALQVPLDINITPPDGTMHYVEYSYGDVLELGGAGDILYRAQQWQVADPLTFNVIKLNIAALEGSPGPLHVKLVTQYDAADPSCSQYELAHWSAPADEVRHSRGLYNGKYVMFLQTPLTLDAGTVYLLVYSESADADNYYAISAGNANTLYGGNGSLSYEYVTDGWQAVPEPVPGDVFPTLSFEVWDNSPGEIRMALDGVLDDETWQPYLFPLGTQYIDVGGAGPHTVCVEYRNLTRPDKDGTYCDTIYVDTTAAAATATIDAIDRDAKAFYLSLSATDAESGVELVSWRVDGGDWSAYLPYSEKLKIIGTPSFRTLEVKFVDGAGNETIRSLSMDQDIYPPEIMAFDIGDGSGFTQDPELPLHIEVADNFDITRITWYETVTGTECEPIEAGAKDFYATDLSIVIPGIPIGGKEAIIDGTYRYYAVAEDSAGNLSARMNTTITLDREPPVIHDMFLTSSTGALVTTSPAMVMNLNAYDAIGPLSMRFRFSDGQWSDRQSIVSGKNRLALEGPAPLPQQYVVSVEVTDGAGHMVSETATLAVNRSPETPDSAASGGPSGIVFSTAPQLTGPAFIDADGDGLAASWFLIRLRVIEQDNTITEQIVHNSGILYGADSWIYTVPDGVLTCDNNAPAEYTWSVRYQDSFGQWSGWSDPVGFTLKQPVLSVQLDGAGSGNVSTLSGVIDCGNGGTDCSETFKPDQIVQLTAVPGNGYVFGGWSGDGCSGTGACDLVMDSDKTVTATFLVLGDINDNGVADLADAVLALQISAGMIPSQPIVRADVNRDNTIGPEEAVYILQKAAGIR